MTGSQTLVGLGGIGLVVANYVTGSQRQPVTQLLQSSGQTSVSAAHQSFVEIGGELIFVAVATILAGMSDGTGKAMLALIIALWILWGISHYSKGQTAVPSSSATSQKSSIVQPNSGSGTVAGQR